MKETLKIELLAATVAVYLLPILQAKSIFKFSFLSDFLQAAQDRCGRQRVSLVCVQALLSILSAAIASGLFYGLYVEPYKLEISRLEIRTSKLRAAHIRIVQLSDLH